MKLLLTFVLILSMTSCGVQKPYVSQTTTADEIQSMAYFYPQAHIHYIKKGNRSVYDDSLSTLVAQKIVALFDKHKEPLRLHKELYIASDTVLQKVKQETIEVFERLSQQKKTKTIAIPLTIDSILNSNDQRFALATLAVGFSRKKGNYGGQFMKSLGISILTLGLINTIPIKSRLALYVLIFDEEKKEVVYFRKTTPVEKVPTDEKALDRFLLKLFEGYLYQEK